MKPKQYTLYIDQYGRQVMARTVKELTEKVGGGKTRRMFVGDGEQIGYVVGQSWFTAWVPKEYKNGQGLETEEAEES